jgi:hypothetical protein
MFASKLYLSRGDQNTRIITKYSTKHAANLCNFIEENFSSRDLGVAMEVAHGVGVKNKPGRGRGEGGGAGASACVRELNMPVSEREPKDYLLLFLTRPLIFSAVVSSSFCISLCFTCGAAGTCQKRK